MKSASEISGEAYQVIGVVASAAGLFDHPDIQRALDYFSGDLSGEILPFDVAGTKQDHGSSAKGPIPTEQTEGPGVAGSMLERMARAIEGEIGKQEMVLTDPLTLRRLMAKRAARAALEAIRTPNALMVEIGMKHFTDPCWPENVAEGWRAQIDAILRGEA